MLINPSDPSSAKANRLRKTPALSDTKILAVVWETMKHIGDRRLFERYQAVSMMLQGYSYAEIGQIIRRSVTTVWQYVRTYPWTSPRTFLPGD